MDNSNITKVQDNSIFPKVSEQQEIRLSKRKELLENGHNPYPAEVKITNSIANIRHRFANLEAEATTGVIESIAGRVIFMRNTGKLCFATIQSGQGDQLQIMLSLKEVGEQSLSNWKKFVDIGDFISAAGEVITSKRGELSLLANDWKIISKALRPLPVSHKELNEETRVRNRHIDLIMSDTARKNARIRIDVVRALRNSLEQRGFLEVETPILQTLQGGATARPFTTHSNALDIDLFLRIAPELFLKRCSVAGFEKVFEINRNFRNEGVDSSHSPEFSMLETYEAYGTYDDSARMIREIIQEVAESVFSTNIVVLADGQEYDLSGTWKTLSMYPSLSEALGAEIMPTTSREELEKYVKKTGVDINLNAPALTNGRIVEELWEALVGHKLSEPTFVKDFPSETSPLAREHRSIKGVSEKWDLYVRGFELATGYSELVDPVIQREKFIEQAALGKAGDNEAMVLDEEFLAAMEQGMPPTTGTGMGIDRLLMALTGLGIRETILFPLVKPLFY